jgi:glutathione S-transferase
MPRRYRDRGLEAAMTELTLVTFPPSLDSELSRFLLSHYRVAYREVRHTLVLSSFYTVAKAGTPLFPTLYGDGLRLDTAMKIFLHLEGAAPPERRLVPPIGSLAAAKEDWNLLHSRLGSGTAPFAYYHLLPLREVMTGPLSDGTPPFEVALVRRGYPVFAGLIRLLLRLTPQREKAARQLIQEILGGVDDRLADGRHYLYGDAISLSDIAFAVAAAPAVWPDEYGGAVPPLEQTPPPLRDFVDECRARPSGAHALRIYREHRNPSGGAA